MEQWQNKQVLVLGLGKSGVAASKLLRRQGAMVLGMDSADSENLRAARCSLGEGGVEVQLGASSPPNRDFDAVIVSPGVPPSNPILREMVRRKVRVIGELELGYEHARCLNIAVTGTNGKTTTTELIERVLRRQQIKTLAAGNIGVPVCDVVDQTAALDFLTLEVSSFQLETIEFFRPIVAVLLNITPDHLDRYASMGDYAKAKTRLFLNQQPFDWAIIQSEALALLRSMNLKIPSKIVTFSASNRRADIYLERGLLISRIEGWSGPLLDLDRVHLRGPHNAENLMAALAVGRVLRIPLETVVEALQEYRPAAHRCELVATVNGVSYINDSKATNLDALHKALLSVPAKSGGEPNIWLIAGGKDKGIEYHDIGPLLSQRVKAAFLLGETRERLRAAWSLFTPCTIVDSLLEAVSRAAENAASGDVVLLSPACSSFDQFQDYRHRGEVFRQAVIGLQPSPKSPSTSAGSARQNAPGVPEH